MIELSKVSKMAMEAGVSPEVVVMEAYQMIILNEMSEFGVCKNLVFKGGTALRLGYQAWRFSEDLDFSVIKKVEFVEFKRMMTIIAKHYVEMEVDEIYNRKNTLFARLVVQAGKYRVGVKVEISKRRERWENGKDYEYKMLKSPVSWLQPYLKTTTLQRIYKDKLRLTGERKKPRDWFDLWFLAEKLDKKFDKKVRVDKKLMMDRVRFLLPKSKRFILDEFEYED